MKTFEKLSALLMLLLLPVAWGGCSDDNDIFFTEDEIIEGDILTGKEIKINSLEVATTKSNIANIRGGKGDYFASSEHPEIAIAETYHSDNDWYVEVRGIAIGTTFITITDSEGNSARLPVKVFDVEDLWKTIAHFQETETHCWVKGATPADSAAIASDILTTNQEKVFILKTSRAIMRLYRWVIKDEKGNILTDVKASSTSNAQHEGDEWWEVRFGLWTEEPSFLYYHQNSGDWLTRDLTEAYQAKYPDVTEVLLLKKCVRK